MTGDPLARAHQEAAAQDAAVLAVDNLITHPFGQRHSELGEGPRETDFDRRSLCLQRVAAALGRSIAPPTPQQRERGDLRAYAENTGLIVRQVQLPERWWRKDFGPLLATTTGGEPVALIRKDANYRLVDLSGTSRDVREREAATVSPEVLSVIPQLPEPITNPWQVGRYGLSGNLSWMLLGTAVSLVAGMVALSAPLAVKAVWDRAVPELDYRLLWGIMFFLAAASFAGMALRIIEKFASLRVGSRYRAFVGPAVWFRLQRVKSSYFRTNPIGVVSQQAALVPGLFQLTVDPLFAAIGLVGFGLPALVLLFVLAPTLAWIAVAAVVVEVVISTLVSWRSARLLQEQLPIGARMTSTIHGLLTGVTTLRVAGAEPYGLEQWGRVLSQHQRVTVRMRYLALGVSVFTLVWPIVVTAAIYVVTGTELLGAIEVGTFLAFMTTYGFFKAAMRKLPETVAVFFTLSKVWPRCSPVFQAPLERELNAIDPGELTGDIALRGVGFAYEPGRNALTDVDLHIAPGTFAAIVGPSGAGKSTIVRLLVGLEDPTEGTLTYNSIDFARLDVEVVRMQMGVVMQGMRPSGDTVREVIDGDRGLDEEQLWSALAFADLADSVHALPMGLDTYVGPGGQAFSGGEVQRLLLARAVAGQPRILVLDEATSAFDDITQEKVMQAVRELTSTRVVIAQRLSTVEQADVIVVIDGGTIAETGTYSELVAKGGVFAGMVAAQLVTAAGADAAAARDGAPGGS